jgi:hypothetical protein
MWFKMFEKRKKSLNGQLTESACFHGQLTAYAVN